MNNCDPWDNFLKGDKKALGEVYLKYYDALLKYAKRLCNDNEFAEDCIQELFLKIWKNRLSLKPVKDLKPYLYISLRNHIFDSIVLRKQIVQVMKEDEIFSIVFSEQDILINEETKEETRRFIVQSLNQLTPRQREIIYLRYFHDLDYEKISDILSINIQSLRNTVNRGITLLRKIMS